MSEDQSSCRYYEKKYPEVDELVVVKVIQIVENGAYVKLLEYNNIEGMITPNEYTKQAHLRSVSKAIRVGKIEVVQVLKVDTEKGYIDLSKKRVQVNQFQEAEDRYTKANKVNSILYCVSINTDTPLPYLYEKFVWPLQRENKNQNILDLMKSALIDPDRIFKNIDISQEIKQKIHQEIKKRLEPKSVKIRTDFELKCFTNEGIEAIKYAHRQGQKLSQPNYQIKFQIYSSPQYFAFINCYDKVKGIEILEQALAELERSILEKQGKFSIIQKPRVIGEREEEELKDMFNELDKQDDNSDDDDDDEDMGSDLGMDDQIIQKA